MDVREILDNIEVIDIKPTEMITFKFSENESEETVQRVLSALIEKYPENFIIGIPPKTYIKTWGRENIVQYRDCLNKVLEAMDSLDEAYK